jgi:hypothetical protein
MRKLPLLLTIVVGVALWAAPSLGADGDQLAGATTSKGDWRIMAAITICDDKIAADFNGAAGDCTQVDLADHPGMTDRLVFARREPAGANCTNDPTLTVTTSEEAAATFEYNLGSAGTDLEVNDATPRVTLMVDQGASAGRYLNFALSDGLGCIDPGAGLDWVMLFVTKAGAGE